MAAHPDQGDAPQRVAGSAVAAAIQPVAVGAARGRRQGRGATQVGEGGLPAQPLGLSPAVTSSCPAVSTPDPGQGDQGGLGIDRIGLAPTTPQATVRPDDLDHLEAVGAHKRASPAL
jgi:hypothetical protein